MPEPLAPGYEVYPFAHQDIVSSEDVVALWTREGVLRSTEAERRLSEVLLVATDPGGRLAAISTAYLHRSEQLRADMWHFRVFVAREHRQSTLAISLAVRARDHLIERFVSGADRRAIGVLYEVEAPVLKQISKARWPWTDTLFIGENARGDHLRVYYFPGALAPEPDGTPPPAADQGSS